MRDSPEYAGYKRRLYRILAAYIAGLLVFLLLLAWAEQQGLPRFWLGPIFMFSTVMVYAGIGIYGRTTDPEEYYVAGRRIPPMFNGMAAAADWMSAASFISLAGGLYLQGFSGTDAQPGGLAYVLGWTGGFCLVALLVAPHLRKLNLYTVPDYFSVRFGGRWPRVIAAFSAVVCSFTYVVAQIYGIGLIASRLTGVQFEIGILLGLGGVLLCSFLGGMKAITWTQVAQYIILLLAFLIPVSWLAYKQLGNPVAPLVYGKQLQKIAELEKRLADDPAEKEVAAGGLAAALSTADGLLLTISNALVRDIYSHEINHHVTPEQRVILSKFALMAVALVAALVASFKPAEILPLVSASFSLAASAFVPVMVLGIFWAGTSPAGAVAGMLGGLGVTVYYMLVNAPAFRAWVGLPAGGDLWFAIQPISAGVFGVPAGFALAVVVSLLRRRP